MGRVIFATALVLTGGVVACGERTPTGPSNLDVTGTWKGVRTVAECQTNGDGRQCQTGTSAEFAITLRQEGESVSGTVFSGSPVSVSGSLSGNTLLLSSSPSISPSLTWRTEVSRVGLGWAMQGEWEERVFGGTLPSGALFMMRRVFAVQVAIQGSSR